MISLALLSELNTGNPIDSMILETVLFPAPIPPVIPIRLGTKSRRFQ